MHFWFNKKDSLSFLCQKATNKGLAIGISISPGRHQSGDPTETCSLLDGNNKNVDFKYFQKVQFLYNSREQLQFGRSIWFIIIKHCQSLVVEGYSILSYKQQSVQLNVLRSTKDKKIKDLNVKRPIFLLKILLNVP